MGVGPHAQRPMPWVFLLIVSTVVTAVVLLVPVRVDLEVDVGAGTASRPVHARVRWLFVSWRSGKAGERHAARERPEPKPKEKRRRRFSVTAALGTPGFLRRLIRAVADLLRVFLPREVRARIRVGLDDPASTGSLFGALYGLTGITSRPDWHLQVEPDFTGPALAGRAELRWSVRPGAVLWPIGRLAASPVTWRAVFAALR